MVMNSYYKCDFCGCTLRFRYQVGAFNIPISVYCPKCNCHISGLVDFGDGLQSIKESIIGASEIDNETSEYIIELSTEFITDKCKKSSEDDEYQFSMFLRSNPFDKERTTRRAELLQFVKDSESCIDTIENLYNLLENDRADLIRKYFLETDNPIIKSYKKKVDYYKVINKLDAMLAVKHYFNTLLRPVMPQGVFDNLYKIMNEKVPRIVSGRLRSLAEYLRHLDNDDLEAYLYRIPKFIIDYIKCVGQLIPVYDNYSNFDSLDLNMVGLSTISVDEMVVIYKKGFELLCDSVDLIVALNNIERHGSYDNFGYGKVDFAKKLNGYGSKYMKYEEVTKGNSDLYDGVKNKLNNIIRNAESHNSIRIDGFNQKITFINKHMGNTNIHKTSFLEFGKECIDLFVAVLHVWEYYYQVVKLKSVFIDRLELHYGSD